MNAIGIAKAGAPTDAAQRDNFIATAGGEDAEFQAIAAHTDLDLAAMLRLQCGIEAATAVAAVRELVPLRR